MKVIVELVYADTSKNRKLEVPIKGEPRGSRLMSAIERGVEKKAHDDKDWVRWNLIEVVE